MKNKLLIKGLMFAIVTLFFGANIIPSITGGIERNNDVKILGGIHEDDWWPMFHHDQLHSGYSTSEIPDKIMRLWIYETEKEISTSPVVANDKIFIGSSDNHLYCLNALSGNMIWKYDINHQYDFSPSTAAVFDDKVYLGGMNGAICCLNASNGSEIWVAPTGGVAPTSIKSPPVVDDGKVYIGGGDSNKGVFCFDAETGFELWNFTAEDHVYNSPAVVDNRVYVGINKLYCLDALNGTLLDNTTDNWFTSSPTIVNGNIYIGSNDNNLYCLDAETLNEIWIFSTGDLVESTPAVAYGNIYFGSNDKKIYCLNADDGHVIWEYLTGGAISSSPAVANDKVVIGSNDKKIYCLDAHTGDEIWIDETDGPVISSPAVTNGLVYVGSEDGKVYAYRGGSFSLEITRPIKGGIYFRDFLLWSYPLLRRLTLQPLFTITFGGITLQINVEDNLFNISYVQFRDGLLPIGDPITEEPYEWYWGTFSPGVHRIGAIAENEVGQKIELSVEECINILRFG